MAALHFLAAVSFLTQDSGYTFKLINIDIY